MDWDAFPGFHPGLFSYLPSGKRADSCPFWAMDGAIFEKELFMRLRWIPLNSPPHTPPRSGPCTDIGFLMGTSIKQSTPLVMKVQMRFPRCADCVFGSMSALGLPVVEGVCRMGAGF